MMGLAPSWPRWKSLTAPSVLVRLVHAHTHTHTHTHPYTYTDSYANAYSYTYARADHAARAWLQSARPANGGPLLEWADSGNIDIYRNGALIATVPNDGGAYTDHINRTGKGNYTYRVLAGTGNCSNLVTVRRCHNAGYAHLKQVPLPVRLM